MADKEIRTILAPLTEGYVMLPNSAVGEILTFTSPEPFKQGPPWLLGEIAWRGWQVPVINYERMLKDNGVTTITAKTRVLIVKTLGESPGQLHRPGHSGFTQAQESKREHTG